MFDQGATAAMARLVATDLSVADHADLADAATAIARVQGFVDLAKVQVNRRTRQLAEQGDRSADHVLLDEARLSGKDAQATAGRDRVCETMPEFEEALAAGGCTGAHLDALAHHTKGLTDDERADLALVVDDLLERAASEPVGLFDRTTKSIVDKIREIHRPGSDVDELERQRRSSKVKRWTDRDTGMRNTLISLDPLRDESIWNVINAHLGTVRRDPANEGRPFGELQVDAVLAAISSGGDRAGRDVGHTPIPEVVIHTDAGSLCHGRHDRTLCETVDGVPVPVSTAQRLCCEAILQAVIVRPDGIVDRVCAEQRTANRQQRRMLAAMYSTCAHPHCQVAFSRCRIHHVVWWTRGGTTVITNLLPLCETHHHLVHEGGWDLSIDDQRRVSWTRPDGTVWLVDEGPNRDRIPGSRRRTGPQQAA